MIEPKFIQIAADKYTAYALDENGQVWKYREHSRRICEGDHSRHQCTFQSAGYWEPLAMQRGWTGWPPTEREQAEAEVDALLK